MGRGPPHGYFLELTKIILVVYGKITQWEQILFQVMSIKVVTGICYLGGFIKYEQRRKIGWGRRYKVWKGWCRCWKGCHVIIRMSPMQACRSFSNKSGT